MNGIIVSKIQEIPIKNPYGIRLYIKREDLIHPFVSGNKYRKLKYNLIEAKQQGKHTLLTFGGAFSNHIAAVAYAGKQGGFKTVGVIRGDELSESISTNPTLRFAKAQGMEFRFVSRADYRKKEDDCILQDLKHHYGYPYTIPEGGTNALAVKGCKEILNTEDLQYHYICCCVGTGGTISGLINASKLGQTVLGFPALKGDFLQSEIAKFATQNNWKLIREYHFGGYAKINTELVTFINAFKSKYNVPLDPIYTGKMLYGVFDKIESGYFQNNSKILVIHTGGLQGITGMNLRLKAKSLPLIHV